MTRWVVGYFEIECIKGSNMKPYCFDRLTAPELVPLHEVRPLTAVSRLDVTTTLMSVKLRAADPPDPEPVAQGGGGCWTYSVIP